MPGACAYREHTTGGTGSDEIEFAMAGMRETPPICSCTQLWALPNAHE